MNHHNELYNEVAEDMLNCISDVEYFPFDPAAPTPRTLQSAVPGSDKLIADLKSAYANGEAKLMKFSEERVFTKVKSIFDFLTLCQGIKVLRLQRNEKKLLHQVKIK